MTSKEQFAIRLGKFVSWVSKTFRIGAGATWPGEIALKISPLILGSFADRFTKGIVLIAGTNGKTTTAHMIETVVSAQGMTVVHNKSGANLLNGIVSACIEQIGEDNKANWGIFEVDENSLPQVLRYIKPKAIVLINLFRDQLDRYGEVDVIAEKWEHAIKKLDPSTTLILNCDDPLISYLGNKVKNPVRYFGLNDSPRKFSEMEHATDSIFCLFCGSRLSYKTVYFSHLGDWYCSKCGAKRPKPNLDTWGSPLPGLYNRYNTLAAVLALRELGVVDDAIRKTISQIKPAFGRQEELVVGKKKIKLFLSKNPAGFNASLKTVLELKPAAMLIALNDRIPDGRDVSWIWDVDFDMIPDSVRVVVSGDRTYDMGIRIKYTQRTKEFFVEPDLHVALSRGLSEVKEGGILFVLATYSAMLDVRKIIHGKKIL
jgi:lipid II isoglutaminyl synthase (glutamine-hydrolysing)